jgi:hypothetical protein
MNTNSDHIYVLKIFTKFIKKSIMAIRQFQAIIFCQSDSRFLVLCDPREILNEYAYFTQHSFFK